MQPTLDPAAQRVLRALFELAQLDRPASAGSVGRAIDMRPADVARVLLVLDARKLVVAERARLTLKGLAVAARVPVLRLREQPHLLARPTLARVDERPSGAEVRVSKRA